VGSDRRRVLYSISITFSRAIASPEGGGDASPLQAGFEATMLDG
jgi:hypothetical protein